MLPKELLQKSSKYSNLVNSSKAYFGFREKPVYEFFKRFFDVLFSFLALISLGWVMIIIGLIVKCQDGGPVFYISYRVSKNGSIFKMYKFRTMVVGADTQLDPLQQNNETHGPTFKMKNDPRITKFGHFLRKTSLDELPQFFNTLNGTMSFVGPRPPLPNEVDQYYPDQYCRLLVKQGLTCIWQVSGRSLTTFEQQVEMDKRYIKKRNIFFDFWLLIRTIPAVLLQKGAE
jgi:lipopolysaccharide/colanic/teichoic acid biosynthesis glycosyltransferase